MNGVNEAKCDTAFSVPGSSSVHDLPVLPSLQLREDVRELEKMNLALLDRIIGLESNLEVALDLASENLCRAECAENETAGVRAQLDTVLRAQLHVDVAAFEPTAAGEGKAAPEILEVMLELESVATLLQVKTERCAELEEAVRILQKTTDTSCDASELHDRAANCERGDAGDANSAYYRDVSKSALPTIALPQPLEEPEEEHFSFRMSPRHSVNRS